MIEKPRKNHFGEKIAERIAREQEQQRILENPGAYPEVEERAVEKPTWLIRASSSLNAVGRPQSDYARWEDWNDPFGRNNWRGD
ncbi:hypothetical protein [Agrobacterium genomosp. 2]|uniref:hypothetical protein n=1 Tax=Agrobacterium genomosp. 2 TaxID=1183409 RepID=UPI0009BC4CEB|nr:hypothetical protein [Agrobacterium genomosp. 2]